MNTNALYRVYAREKEKGGRWKPMDLSTGRMVTNLIFASILTAQQADAQIKYMNENNNEYEFKRRKV